MLTCPHCRKPIQEDSEVCPHPDCQFSLAGIHSILSPLPYLNKGLTDTLGLLEEKKKNEIHKAVASFGDNHAPCNLHITIKEFDPNFNLSVQLFWLFNKAGFSSIEARVAANQDILVGLDPNRGRIGMMVGYGLEPFVSEKAMNNLLAQAQPLLESNQFEEALLQITKNLPILLKACAQSANTTLGLVMD